MCICLVAVIILPLNKVSASTGNDNSYETKTYYTGSINDDFCDDKIIVVLTKEETRKNLEYTIEDFNEIDCANVTDLTANIFESILNNRDCLVDVDNFNRILCLELKNKTKENVLESI